MTYGYQISQSPKDSAAIAFGYFAGSQATAHLRLWLKTKSRFACVASPDA